MHFTQHEVILDYMTLSGNETQEGYPVLKKACELSWYPLFKETKESIVRKWVEVNNGIVKMPKSLERLLGCYIVDSCGDLAPLFEDNGKAILLKPATKCKCNACDIQECLCPTIQAIPVQIDITLNGQPYTNTKITRVLKDGSVIEESETWVPSFYENGSFKSVEKIEAQTVRCKVDVKDCGCPIDTPENVAKLSACGCINECYTPYNRNRYPAMFNSFGYYKKDDTNKEVHIFNSDGSKSNLIQIELVFESNGADALVNEYSRRALIALIDFTKKQYSPVFTSQDRIEARRNWSREERWMIEYLNPIPFEFFVRVADPTKKSRYYNKPHSDFMKPEVIVVCQPMPVQNITNIIESDSAAAASTGYLKKIVDVGDGPVSGSATYQHNLLKGLGTLSDDKIELLIDKTWMYNWGDNKDFDFNKSTGTMTFLNGYVWQGDFQGVVRSTLSVNLNQ